MAVALLPNNAMTFTENQHGTAVLEKLRGQRELIRCCDVILHVAGLQFQAHRCVLAACSPYFDSIFKTSKTVKEQLTVSSQDPEVFRCLLAYMYTGTVVVDRTNVAELLRLANKLLLAKLKEHCAEYLERYLDPENCLAVRDMATKYNLEALEKTTVSFIAGHLMEVMEGEEVLELSHARLEDFLRCPLWEVEEDQTLLLVTCWVHHHPTTRERNLRSLLTWVQWARLDPQAAIHLIQTHPLYTSPNSLLALFFLLDALNEHSMLSQDFLAPFSKLKAKFCQSTDSVVDNESFYSLAISAAIDELQEDPISGRRSQEPPDVDGDLSSHTGPPLHPTQATPPNVKDEPPSIATLQPHLKVTDFLTTSRRGCDSQENHMSARRDCSEHETEQCSQYDMGRIVYSSQDMHINQPNLVYSHAASTSNVLTCHTHISDHLVGDTTSTEEGNFPSNSQGHVGQHAMKNLGVWHQEPTYGTEESLSSDSSHMYQRQVYDQGFSIKPCSDSYDTRMNSSGIFAVRESPHKTKQSFASAMSYYVSTYNPDDDMTVSDDQSAQSFYDEKCTSNVNFYSCRLSDMKENTHSINEHHNHENFPKSYYHSNSGIKQETDCSQSDIYYNENSTDTQISNCPQDMTIQHQLAQTSDARQCRENADNDSENAMTAVQSAPERLLEHEPHYQHYPLKNNADNKYPRDMSRTGEQLLAVGLSRMGVNEAIQGDEKRPPLNCNLEAKGIITIIGGGAVVQADKVYKMCSLEKDSSYNGSCGSGTKSTSPKESSSPANRKSLREDCTGDVSEEKHPGTSRQVKFKMVRNMTSSVSPPGSNQTPANTTQFPWATQTPGVLDFTHFESEELDPDDPQQISQDQHCDAFDGHGTRQDDEAEDNQMCILEEGSRQDNTMVDSQIDELGQVGKLDNASGDSDIRSIEEEVKRLDDDTKPCPENIAVMSSSGRGAGVTNPTACQQKSARRMSSRVKPAEESKEGAKTPSGTKERVCDMCQASFSQTRKYYLHMRGHFPGPPHHCDTCEASFKRIYYLLDHRASHQDIRTHHCHYCPFTTRRKFNLTQHLHTHTNTKKFICQTCGDSFSRIQILKIHETRHTKERPFLCETCGWSGKTKNALITHTKTHTGELLRCQVEGCSYSTAKRSHLKEHMQHHSNCRPFVCHTCGRDFITKSHMRRHIKLHLPDKPFKCSQCDYCSLRQEHLKMHIEKKHTQKKPPKVVARKRQTKKKGAETSVGQQVVEETNVMATHIKCSQGEIFSDLESTNISLQPQLPTTPPPTTLSEYPASPTYTFPTQAAPDDPLMMVPDMSAVTEGFTHLPHNYEGSNYHSPQYQTSPSHFAALSPTHTALSYANTHHQEESPLNFAAYMKYD